MTSQMVATLLTIVILIGIGLQQVFIARNVWNISKANKAAYDGLIASGRKMGEGWLEVAQAIDEMQKRIDLQEQRILSLEGRRWTVHNGGKRDGSDDPTGGDAA